jgi:hypothetical protein
MAYPISGARRQPVGDRSGAYPGHHHKINAKGEGAFTGPTTTASQILGGGIVHGNTTADLTITGIDPQTGVLTYAGTLVLTAEHGMLRLDIFNGVYDTATGEFSNDTSVIDGTDDFVGATGSLYFHGFVFPDGSFVDDTISGVITVDFSGD